MVVEPAHNGAATGPLAEELRALLDGVADAITAQVADGRLVYANEAAARLYGMPQGAALEDFSTDRYLDRRALLDEHGRPFDLSQLPGRLVLAGADPEPVILQSRDPETGTPRWSRIKASAVRDADGRVRLAVNLVEDITELKRSEAAQRFLADASRALAGSLDYERTLDAVAELATPALAETCVLTLTERDDGHEPDDAVAGVLAGGPAWLDERELVVPLPAPGRVLGALALRCAPPRRFDTHDLRVAEDLGLRAGAALENARLYRAASEIARTLQTSLLPPHLPEVAGAELAAAYHPAWEGLEVGGDFYDVFATAEGQWYFVIGDVCGKGAEAAAVTALARYTLRAAAAHERSPAVLLRWVGEAMLHQEPARGRYCTIACAHVDLTCTPARVTVACGGHPLPVVRRADGTVTTLGAYGTLLGLVEDPDLRERSADLHPGDALVLYTDGLTEAHAPDALWGPEELAAAVAAAPPGAAGLVDALVAAALDGRGDGGAPRDDLAVLALRVT